MKNRANAHITQTHNTLLLMGLDSQALQYAEAYFCSPYIGFMGPTIYHHKPEYWIRHHSGSLIKKKLTSLIRKSINLYNIGWSVD